MKDSVDVCLCREGKKGRNAFPAEGPTCAKADVTKKAQHVQRTVSSVWLEFGRHRDEKDMVPVPEEFTYGENRHGENQAIKCYLH